MKAKGAIRDVARILRVPLNQVNELTKKIPNNGSLSNAFKIINDQKKKLGSLEKVISDIDKQYKKAIKEEKDNIALLLETRKIIAEEMLKCEQTNDQGMLKTLDIACTLEGSVRQTGVHACGILIGRDSLDQSIPLMKTKENDGDFDLVFPDLSFEKYEDIDIL